MKELVKKYSVEFTFLAVILFFLGGIGVASLYLDNSFVGEVKELYWQVSGGNALSTGNIVADCKKAQNRNQRVCVERRARVASTWKSVRGKGTNRSPAFSLHGN